MNALDVLKADHKALQKLLKKVDSTSERGVKIRQELFAKIKHEAEIHEKAEEKYLYPLVKDQKKARADSLEHYEEVKIMSRLLKELSAAEVNSEEWTAKFSVFKELSDHHIEEEENEFFPRIAKLVSNDELIDAGEKIIDFKNSKKLS